MSLQLPVYELGVVHNYTPPHGQAGDPNEPGYIPGSLALSLPFWTGLANLTAKLSLLSLTKQESFSPVPNRESLSSRSGQDVCGTKIIWKAPKSFAAKRLLPTLTKRSQV